MKYYKIRINPELAGTREVYLQNNKSKYVTESLLKYDSLPNFKPVFSEVIINKPTDVISDSNIGGKGFIVNQKLKELLLEFNLDTHEFYPLDVFLYGTNEKLEENYFWFQIVSTDFENWINYRESTFYLSDDFNNIKLHDLNINNRKQLKQEINNTLNTDNIVIYKKLVFNNNFANFDFFYMNDLFENIFNFPIVSEKLKNKIEEDNIISFEFKEVNIHVEL